jgi:hypothetical protein
MYQLGDPVTFNDSDGSADSVPDLASSKKTVTDGCAEGALINPDLSPIWPSPRLQRLGRCGWFGGGMRRLRGATPPTANVADAKEPEASIPIGDT